MRILIQKWKKWLRDWQSFHKDFHLHRQGKELHDKRVEYYEALKTLNEDRKKDLSYLGILQKGTDQEKEEAYMSTKTNWEDENKGRISNKEKRKADDFEAFKKGKEDNVRQVFDSHIYEIQHDLARLKQKGDALTETMRSLMEQKAAILKELNKEYPEENEKRSVTFRVSYGPRNMRKKRSSCRKRNSSHTRWKKIVLWLTLPWGFSSPFQKN